MKKLLSIALIICLLCSVSALPVKAQSQTEADELLYYEFDFSEDKLYTDYHRPVTPEGITYDFRAVSTNGNSIFSHSRINDKDALYVKASHSTENVVFTPLKEDGTPIVLKPDTKYVIEWEFYITRFAGSWARPYIELYTSTDGLTGYNGIAASRKENGETVYLYADKNWNNDPKNLSGHGSLLGYKRQLSYWHNGSSFGADEVRDAYIKTTDISGSHQFFMAEGNQYDSGVSYNGKKFSYTHTVRTPANSEMEEFSITANEDGSYTYKGRDYNNFLGLSLPGGYGEYYLEGYDEKSTENVKDKYGNYFHRSYSEYYITGLKIYEVEVKNSTVTLLDGISERKITGETESELVLPSTLFGADRKWYTSPDASLSSVCTLTQFPENDITLYSASYVINKQKSDGEKPSTAFSDSYSVTDEDIDGEYELYYDSPNKTADGYASNFFRLGKVEDNTTYKITVTYKAIGSDLGFCFYTADSEDVMKYSTAISGKPVHTVIATNDGYKTVELFINTFLMGQLTSTDADDKKTVLGDTLYFGIKDSDISGNSDIYIKDIKYENIGDAVFTGGVSILNSDAYNKIQSQAMRFYCSYKTDDGSQLYIGDKAYKVVRRGFLYTDGSFKENALINKETLDESGTNAYTKEKTSGMTVDSAEKYVNKYVEKNLSSCWQYSAENRQMTFSTYIKDFHSSLMSKKLMLRGYVTVLVDGAEMTLYSDIVNRSVNSLLTVDGRKLVWSDEFGAEDISEITTLTQNYDTMYSNDSNLVVSRSENNYFVDKNTGELVLRITSDGNKNYTTAKSVTTRGIMSFKYGYLEMRAKVPYKKCVWPSFWLQPNKSSWNSASNIGEIDILEVFSSKDTAVANLHKWYLDTSDNIYKTDQIGARGNILYGDGQRKYVFSSPEKAQEYHTYGFEWTEEFMAFYIDGELYYKVSITEEDDYSKEHPGMDCFHKYYYICFNNWMYTQEQTSAPSSHWVENNEDVGSVDYRIDYIRLYQRDGESMVNV